jgi:hypothetical protein
VDIWGCVLNGAANIEFGLRFPFKLFKPWISVPPGRMPFTHPEKSNAEKVNNI